VVISIIMILATMGMTQYRNSVIYAREGVLKEDLFRMRDAIDQYYADKGQYPSTLDALVSDGYVRKLPEDPFTKSSTSWQTVPAFPRPETGEVNESIVVGPLVVADTLRVTPYGAADWTSVVVVPVPMPPFVSVAVKVTV